MFSLPSNLDVYVATEPTDMRRSFDGLASMVQEVLSQDPLSGQLFVFFNKRYDKLKILYWDRNGFALWYKRLADGVFRPPPVVGSGYSLSVQELTLLLSGIDLTTRRSFSTVDAMSKRLD
jgi:transposase